MNPSVRQAIQDDVLGDYQEPSPDLALRVLRTVHEPSDGRQARRLAKPALQTFGVVLAGVLFATVLVGVRVARGDMALPAGLPYGGLHPPAASYSIVDAQYFSADTAWIVAQLHVHNGPTVIMNTTDGGRTWHEQFRMPDGSGIGSFHFWNTRDGDLVEVVPTALPSTPVPGSKKLPNSNTEERIYRTHDGGVHWELVEGPVDLTGDTYFLTQNEGWRLVMGQTERAAGTVQHTLDGGRTWLAVGTVAGSGQLWFKDSKNGWISVAESKTYSWDATGKMTVHDVGPTLLYATRDGGATWTPEDLPLGVGADADVRIESPVFFGQNDAVLPFEVLPPPSSSSPKPGQPTGQGKLESYVLQSHDGGRHWSDPVLTPGGLQQGGALFLDAKHWLTSAGPTLHETFDAGKTWSSRQVLADGLEFNFAPWNYIDAKAIWSQVGADRLVRSTDGGAHWTSVTPPKISQ